MISSTYRSRLLVDRGTSKRVKTILRNYNSILSNKSSNTLFKKFNNLKDPLPLGAKIDAINQLCCENCDNVNIGEMEKKVCGRANKHFAAVRN